MIIYLCRKECAIMATSSFTRNIIISEKDAIRRVKKAMKTNGSTKFKTSIKNVDDILAQSRSDLSTKLTQKY